MQAWRTTPMASAIALALGFTTSVMAEPQSSPSKQLQSETARSYQIPSGTLTQTLNKFAQRSGVVLVFDPALTQSIDSKGLSGSFTTRQGFEQLLQGSGLELVNDQHGGFYLDKSTKPQPKDNLPGEKSSLDFKVDAIEVRAKRFYEIGPLPGLGLTKEEIPGNVQSLTAKDIKEAHSLSITDLMNSKLQSVNVNDYQGNPFQMDVQYRGFTAGPQIGTPQGLSVFFDGIRVNEPFGDVVNWDMLPLNALASFDVFPGSNPIFGLGTLGGALSMKTKDGFNNPGVDAEILNGSYGRRQLQATGGWNNGTVAGFAAANIFLEDGWRDNSPSRVNQVFGKGSYRGDKLDLNLSTLVVWNDLVGNGLLPNEMYRQDRNGVFTSPDTTDNRLWQFQLSGSYFVSDNFTITGQAYRRNSKRKSVGADVYTEYGNQRVKRNLRSGEQWTCLYDSDNANGLPNYYVMTQTDASNPFAHPFFSDPTSGYQFTGVPDWSLITATDPGAFNKELPPEVLAHAISQFNLYKNPRQAIAYVPQGQGPIDVPMGDTVGYSNSDMSEPLYQFQTNEASLTGQNVFVGLSAAPTVQYYWTADESTADPTDGIRHVILVVPARNAATCNQGGMQAYPDAEGELNELDSNGLPIVVDGAYDTFGAGRGTVEGTPTAVLTNTQIDQITDGASVQFNWNYPKHKFMLGASIDTPSATYSSGQRLGLMDAQRNVFLAPNEIRDQYAAADIEVHNNDFSGKSLTKSLYASETWSPIETLHFTGAMRYNETRGSNKIASRTFGTFVFDLSDYLNFPDNYNTCVNGVCPTTGYKTPDLSNVLNKPEREKFSYYSLNPSLGVSWQAKESLNLHANWAQGTRTPSVIELGCALDKTVVITGYNGPDPIYGYKSIAENRSCSLPSTLSGDPYLPQIRAQTIDVGARGRWGEHFEWNIGAYRTDLKDDIYLVTFPGNKSFFDTIGNTRRQGIEAGFTASIDKLSLRFNYALTDATFQDSFTMASDHNSSATFGTGQDAYLQTRSIRVNPGNRMPGVPLHNLNATLSYDITSKWRVGLTAVAHSSAYVRGNENNEHEKGVTQYITAANGDVLARQPTSNPGSVAGYAVFNFRTSYKLNSEWTASLMINNLFDREYFTAGRLGRNPFSPSIQGAIGPDGYNHNSNDWLSTNFIAPGAPRGIWFSLGYEFDPRK